MEILVTGGTGYIGSHTSVELLNANYKLIIIDNLSNSNKKVLKKIGEITNKKIRFYHVDILNKKEVNQIFDKHNIKAVIHLAGLKAVGESVANPLRYYHNNVGGTISLLQAMEENNIKKIVFSSSATVYGDSKIVPIKEEFPLSATNPYGRTKLIIEKILKDIYQSDREWSISLLRYFNPVGAHESGKIGEDPSGKPNNLMPYITKVALGQLDRLAIFGNDYDTPDGTGIRDYIHVVDLARGHIRALDKILESNGIYTYNLGTGTGYSVLEIINKFEKVTGRKIPYSIEKRRPGDIAKAYADSDKAFRELGWKAEKDIDDMCRDAWNWQVNNPNGYNSR